MGSEGERKGETQNPVFLDIVKRALEQEPGVTEVSTDDVSGAADIAIQKGDGRTQRGIIGEPDLGEKVSRERLAGAVSEVQNHSTEKIYYVTPGKLSTDAEVYAASTTVEALDRDELAAVVENGDEQIALDKVAESVTGSTDASTGTGRASSASGTPEALKMEAVDEQRVARRDDDPLDSFGLEHMSSVYEEESATGSADTGPLLPMGPPGGDRLSGRSRRLATRLLTGFNALAPISILVSVLFFIAHMLNAVLGAYDIGGYDPYFWLAPIHLTLYFAQTEDAPVVAAVGIIAFFALPGLIVAVLHGLSIPQLSLWYVMLVLYLLLSAMIIFTGSFTAGSEADVSSVGSS